MKDKKKRGVEGEMGEKPIQSMEISQYSIASHRCHFTNKVERGGNVWIVHTHKLHLFRLFSQTCVCVCVCARLLLSLHHDFEYV